jgi:hypothetical protein
VRRGRLTARRQTSCRDFYFLSNTTNQPILDFILAEQQPPPKFDRSWQDLLGNPGVQAFIRDIPLFHQFRRLKIFFSSDLDNFFHVS